MLHTSISPSQAKDDEGKAEDDDEGKAKDDDEGEAFDVDLDCMVPIAKKVQCNILTTLSSL